MTSHAPCSQSPVFSAGLYDMNRISQTASHTQNQPSGNDEKAILIIEDEKLVAWDIEQSLRDQGFHNFMFATSLRSSRDLMQTSAHHIALAILDLKLEDGDATDLIDEFMERGIAVMVVTGYSGFVHARVPVIHKPFDTKKLLETVFAGLKQTELQLSDSAHGDENHNNHKDQAQSARRAISP
jgi:DNA-binding NtrC family response regulator